jgi:hypothetical protein
MTAFQVRHIVVTTCFLVLPWFLLLESARCWSPPPPAPKKDGIVGGPPAQQQHPGISIDANRRRQQWVTRILGDALVAATVAGSAVFVPLALAAATTSADFETSTTLIQTSSSTTSTSSSTPAMNELPSFLRDYTNLAPLGQQKAFAGRKSVGLPLQELAERLTRDLTVGANGRGGSFLTGDLSMDIFLDDCTFEDPTNRVASLSQYQRALTVLFDPETSYVDIVTPLAVNEDEGTITGRLRSGGYLKLPWRPYIKPYETTITYTVDRKTGLIARQDQSWSISASEALRETFTPSVVNPPPKSTRSL